MGTRTADHRVQRGYVPVRVAQLSLLIVPLLLSGLPLGVFGSPSTSPSGATPGAAVAVSSPSSLPSETVAVENQTNGNLSNFWGVGENPTVSLDNATAETQPTPITWYVWPAGKLGDSYNMSSGTLWTEGFPTQAPTNESQFVRWCKTTSCHTIFTVPGEIDNPANAAFEVAYTEQVLNFHPVYWEIGNEPFGWTHFGLNWSAWNVSNNLRVTNVTYASVVHSYIAAMKGVDPTLQFIGLPGVGAGTKPDGPWINATVRLNGPNLSAIAIHDYPGENGPVGGTVAQFFSTLTAAKSSPLIRLSKDQQDVKAVECPTCHIPILVDEFGAGTGALGAWQPFMRTYPEVPYVTAELLMFMQSNVSNADIFTLRSGYNGSLFDGEGLPFPLDSLYTQILPHYDLIPLATNVTGALKGVFVGVSESASANSLTLLAVNTNLTQAVQLNVTGSVFPREGSYSILQADNSTTSENGTFSSSFGFESSPSWQVPPLGVILVSVCRTNASLGSGGLYPLTFCESGLPSGMPWSVTVGSSTAYSTTGTISFSEPNGTYSYQIGSVQGWRTLNTSGSVTVTGAPASIQVPWTAVPYPVTFTEIGLPTGTLWSVNFSGTWYASTSSNITMYEPNGTYPYALGIVHGWTTPQFHGWVYVDVTPVVVVVNWTQVRYLVTFHETGLPARTNWSVNLSGVTENSTTTTIRYNETNGTYTYTVGSVAGYTPNVRSGSVGVDGYTMFVPLSWATTVFAVQFNETGLPAGTTWNVTLNGTLQSGAVTNFTFYEPNGSYPYSLSGAAGWAPPSYLGNVGVAGASILVVIPYTQVKYLVTFNETGLPYPRPTNGNWSVNLSGTTEATPSPILQFEEPNGTFSYTVGPEAGYTTTWQGEVTVNGNSTSVNVSWSQYRSTVTIDESGLPHPLNWTFDISGRAPVTTFVGNQPPPTFLPNASYNYSVTTSASGWVAIPSQGSFTVNGTPLWFNSTFVTAYPVTFTESGLPDLTNWTVTLGGVPATANSSSINFTEPNGTYSFQVGRVPGLDSTPSSGSIDVIGAAFGQPIAFSPPTWSVNFTETGLNPGTYWSVTLGSSSAHSTGSTISFQEPNGTYDYTVSAVPGWSPAPGNGSATVTGQNIAIPIAWTQVGTLYSVTFTESGLPSGTLWSVTLDQSVSNSTGASVLFQEPNGSYSYEIGTVAGWVASPDAGSPTVQGANVTVPVQFTRVVVNYTVTFTSSGLPSGTNWSVTLSGGTTHTSNGSSIVVQLPKGVYVYVLGGVLGWTAGNATGSVTVPPSHTVLVHWTPKLYSVTFAEAGLPSGSAWSATLNGDNRTSNSTALTYMERDGTYAFTIQGPPGFVPNHDSGTVVVNGSSARVSVTFAATGGGGGGSPALSLTSVQLVAIVAVGFIVGVVGVLWVRSLKEGTEPPPAMTR